MTDFGYVARPDGVVGLINCTIVMGVPQVTCPAPVSNAVGTSTPTGYTEYFVADDVGKAVGTGQRIPFVSVITSTSGGGLTSGITINLASAPPYGNAGLTHVADFSVVAGGGGSGYKFGSTQTLNCTLAQCPTSDGHVPATGTPAIMSVTSATPFSSGSGSPTSGPCVLHSVSQTGIGGTVTQLTGSVSGSTFTLSSISTPGLVANDAGTYSSSSGTYQERFADCGYVGGGDPVFNITYTIVAEQISPGAGIYTVSPAPCQYAAGDGTSTSMGDGGTGLTLSCNTAKQTFPGTVSFGTDNSTVMQQAMGDNTSRANKFTMNFNAFAGTPICLYLPAGTYLTFPLNTGGNSGNFVAKGYGCWFGDGPNTTIIGVIPNTQGDVFAWTDASGNGSLPDLGNTQTFGAATGGASNTANQGGSIFRDMTIIGDRLSTKRQMGLTFYGRTAFVNIHDIIINYLYGRAIWAGSANSAFSVGDFIESSIQDSVFFDDGIGPSFPTIEITSAGGVDASNTLDLHNIRIFQSFGAGLWIHNPGSSGNNNARDIKLSDITAEGSSVSLTNSGGDLLEIGDPSATTYNVGNIVGRNIQLINPVQGYDALHIAGGTAASTIGIDIEGSIAGQMSDPGRGLGVDSCAGCNFKFAQNSAVDYQFVVGQFPVGGTCGSSQIGSPGIVYDAAGGESTLTTCIDPAAAGLVQYPVRQTLLTAAGTTAPVNAVGNLVATDPAVGASTITVAVTSLVPTPLLPINAKYPLWTLLRTGQQTGNFTDTLDTTPDILAALTPLTSIPTGSVFHLRICNQTVGNPLTVAPAETLVAGDAGTTLSGTTVINQGVCVPYTITVTGSSTLSIVGG